MAGLAVAGLAWLGGCGTPSRSPSSAWQPPRRRPSSNRCYWRPRKGDGPRPTFGRCPPQRPSGCFALWGLSNCRSFPQSGRATEPRRTYAGYAMHLALASLALGVAGSSLGTRQKLATLAQGESARWAGATCVSSDSGSTGSPERLVVQAELEVTAAGAAPYTLQPAQEYYFLAKPVETDGRRSFHLERRPLRHPARRRRARADSTDGGREPLDAMDVAGRLDRPGRGSALVLAGPGRKREPAAPSLPQRARPGSGRHRAMGVMGTMGVWDIGRDVREAYKSPRSHKSHCLPAGTAAECDKARKRRMIDPPAAIRARQLSKSFGGRIVLDALDLEIAPGQSVAVTGANGAGKTTLLGCLASVAPARRRRGAMVRSARRPQPGDAPLDRPVGP